MFFMEYLPSAPAVAFAVRIVRRLDRYPRAQHDDDGIAHAAGETAAAEKHALPRPALSA
jgi:hypothetical protein